MSFMVRHIVLVRVREAHVYDDKSICGGGESSQNREPEFSQCLPHRTLLSYLFNLI
jgi:hypothetical protein